MNEAEQIKPIYSDIVIDILDKATIEFLFEECHRLRGKKGLMNKSDAYVLISALKMYKRYQERVLRNREKKGLKNG